MSGPAPLKPPAFDTLFMGVSDPVDLALNTTILPETPDIASGFLEVGDLAAFRTREIFLQTIEGSAKFREGGTEPAADADGHLLGAGDGVVVTIARGRSFWIWGGADARIAVSPAGASPTRETAFDQVTPAA